MKKIKEEKKQEKINSMKKTQFSSEKCCNKVCFFEPLDLVQYI